MTDRKFVTQVGSYNEMPEPARLITEDEYIELCYAAHEAELEREHRQILDFPYAPYMVSARITWFYSYAVMVCSWSAPCGGRLKPYEKDDRIVRVSDMMFAFFEVGCDHEYGSDEGRYLHQHRRICGKCGYISEVWSD